MKIKTSGKINRSKVEEMLRLAKKGGATKVQLERLEKLLTEGGQEQEIAGFFEWKDREKNEGLESYIGGNRSVFVSIVDHNGRHLEHALERDALLTQQLIPAINGAQPLVVLYERDLYSFMGACLSHEYDEGATFIKGSCYNAFVQVVELHNTTDTKLVPVPTKPAFFVTLFKLPEK